nr:hypothetical protein [uncultured Desulfuromonas sp.]
MLKKPVPIRHKENDRHIYLPEKTHLKKVPNHRYNQLENIFHK